MKPPLAVTLYQSRRGVLSSAGSLGGYDGEWREELRSEQNWRGQFLVPVHDILRAFAIVARLTGDTQVFNTVSAAPCERLNVIHVRTFASYALIAPVTRYALGRAPLLFPFRNRPLVSDFGGKFAGASAIGFSYVSRTPIRRNHILRVFGLYFFFVICAPFCVSGSKNFLSFYRASISLRFFFPVRLSHRSRAVFLIVCSPLFPLVIQGDAVRDTRAGISSGTRRHLNVLAHRYQRYVRRTANDATIRTGGEHARKIFTPILGGRAVQFAAPCE